MLMMILIFSLIVFEEQPENDDNEQQYDDEQQENIIYINGNIELAKIFNEKCVICLQNDFIYAFEIVETYQFVNLVTIILILIN